MTFSPSKQQQAVFDWVTNGKGSTIVEAVAGSGKTTTLLEAISRMRGLVTVVAYNGRVRDTMKAKLASRGWPAHVRPQAKTFHGIGWNAWGRSQNWEIWKPEVTARRLQSAKVRLLVRDMNTPEPLASFVLAAVTQAKQIGIGLYGPGSIASRAAWEEMIDRFDLVERLEASELNESRLVEEGIDWSIRVLEASAQQCSELCDFDDQLWAPLYFNTKMVQQDWLLVDEAQDTNAPRRAMARRLLKPGGRLIAVGDRHQAIYGFTGADYNSLDLIAKDHNASELPLTVSFRCPTRVVALAQTVVDHIEAAPNAPLGETTSIVAADFWNTNHLATLKPTDVLLCRYNAPLAEIALRLIRCNIPCRIEGKQIGAGLLALARRWKVTELASLVRLLEDYRDREVAKLLRRGKETEADNLSDRVGTLLYLIRALVAENGQATVHELRKKIEYLFEDSDPPQGVKPPPRFTLSTVHKAKGGEWDHVYLWGRTRFMPSSYARRAEQVQQEMNLIYIAYTRAMHTFTDVHLED